MLVVPAGVPQQNHYRFVEKQRGEWPFDTIHSQDLYTWYFVHPIVYGKPHQYLLNSEISMYSKEVEAKMVSMLALILLLRETEGPTQDIEYRKGLLIEIVLLNVALQSLVPKERALIVQKLLVEESILPPLARRSIVLLGILHGLQCAQQKHQIVFRRTLFHALVR